VGCWVCGWRVAFWKGWENGVEVVVLMLRVAIGLVYFVVLGRRARRVVRASDSIVGLWCGCWLDGWMDGWIWRRTNGSCFPLSEVMRGFDLIRFNRVRVRVG